MSERFDPAREFRAMMDHPPAEQAELLIGAAKGCNCGCGRPAGVTISASSPIYLTSADEVVRVIDSLKLAARALKWDV